MGQLATCLAIPAALTTVLVAGCDFSVVPDGSDTSIHPKDFHEFPLPPVSGEGTQVATGVRTGEALAQPIQFTHHRHVTVLQMDCQYCHTEARRSIHAGAPPVELCMGCHKYVLNDRPQIQTLTAYWESQEPVPWAKVHDLPDYVHFSHARHVGAGVDCTECHGQVGLQGEWPGGDAEQAEVMIRETSLQMGWCLDCHASHPSIDDNYGDHADLRRAELKDCWTCHK